LSHSIGLTLNFNPPNLCLLSSHDYRREPLALSWSVSLLFTSRNVLTK
jgi:hypothetical protein